MANQKIRIRLKGYDHEIVDQSTKLIVDTALKNKLGARGLRTICEKIFTDAMFEAPSSRKKHFSVTAAYARQRLSSDGQ